MAIGVYPDKEMSVYATERQSGRETHRERLCVCDCGRGEERASQKEAIQRLHAAHGFPNRTETQLDRLLRSARSSTKRCHV